MRFNVIELGFLLFLLEVEHVLKLHEASNLLIFIDPIKQFSYLTTNLTLKYAACRFMIQIYFSGNKWLMLSLLG